MLWDTKSLSKFWGVQKVVKLKLLSHKDYPLFLLCWKKLGFVGCGASFLMRMAKGLGEHASCFVFLRDVGRLLRWDSLWVVLSLPFSKWKLFVIGLLCNFPSVFIGSSLWEMGLILSRFSLAQASIWKHFVLISSLAVSWFAICMRNLPPLRMSVSRVGGSSKCLCFLGGVRCQDCSACIYTDSYVAHGFCGTCSCLHWGSLVFCWLLARPIHGCCCRHQVECCCAPFILPMLFCALCIVY